MRLPAGDFVLYARREKRNVLTLEKGLFSPRRDLPKLWARKPKPDELERIAEDLSRFEVWGLGAICVVPHLQSGRSVVAVRRGHTFPNAMECYCWVTDDLCAPVGFDITNEIDRAKSELENLTIALNTPDAGPQFAYRWFLANPDERADLWRREVEKFKQLEALMKAALYGLPEVWAKVEAIRLYLPHVCRANCWFEVKSSYPQPFPDLSARTTELALKWGQLWQTHFLPVHVFSLQTNNNSLSQKNSLSKVDFDLPFQGAVAHAPTAHEQIEACLHLRAWLQRNAPEHLDELLPNLNHSMPNLSIKEEFAKIAMCLLRTRF